MLFLMDNLPDRSFVLDGVLSAMVSIFQHIFLLLQHNFYVFHDFRISLFDFALSLMVLDIACQLLFPWYSSDDENE